MVLKKIIAGPIGVNCYIIGCERTGAGAVIDPGENCEIIFSVLKDNHIDLKYILLTHGHIDHLAHLNRVKEKTNAEFLMHKDDQFLLRGLSAQALMFGLPDPGKLLPDRFVEDNEKISLGELTITVLHTPGHSPGSVTFCVAKKLFVGDLIFEGSVGRTDLPGGNHQTLIDSVESKIFTLPPETEIYPGHGPHTTVRQEKASNPFF